MKPIRTFEVVPYLPPELEGLKELAYNLRWTWDHEAVGLFVRLDRELWEKYGHNPALMLGAISQERLNEAAADEAFMAHTNRILNKFRGYMKSENTWFRKHGPKSHQGTIAYFSAEYGLTECLPIYSGGLGILAGDHVKAASEQGLPVVGVGIAYQEGYFQQYLNPDGWQQERYPMNDFYNMPITPVTNEAGERILVDVDFPGRKVYAQIWKAQVGRVPLYLLDTNIGQNPKPWCDITDALYHGDSEIRIQQEMILGIGGMRALKALGVFPAVCHMNEGHSAFLGLERIAMLMAEHKLSFAEAKEVAACGNVFTTHTAVPAGIDKFSPDLVDKYLGDYYRQHGISREDFLALGRLNRQDNHEPFSMAYLAINLSSRTNAVSSLHGHVSRKLFGGLWRGLPEEEVPITHITNGIHTRSWISEEMAEMFDRYLGPRWSEDVEEQDIWRRVEDIPDEELWRIHERRRRALVGFCRRRLRQQLSLRGALPSDLKEASEVLDPEALTIGFARRVATYKRATMLLKNPERLAQILNNKERPLQIIIAGKAHPEDTPAKELIRQIVHFARTHEVRRRFVFLENYDINVARWLVQGVDVWLNTPKRFLEACGTSGMKAAFNGAMNVSTLDGWWDEAYEPHAGFAIGHGEVYADQDYQDEVESNALYDLLEKEIVPLFYDRTKDGVARGWITRMKQAMLHICPMFDMNRMVREYATRAYFPAALRYQEFLGNEAEKAKRLSSWKSEVARNFRELKIESVEVQSTSHVQVGDDMRVRAKVSLGKFSPDDLSVQIYHGPIDTQGNIIQGEIIPMTPSAEGDGQYFLFSGAIRYFKSGRHGFTVRVLPHHDDLGSPLETRLVLWADGRPG